MEIIGLIILGILAGGIMWACVFLISSVPFLGIALCATAVLLSAIGVASDQLRERNERRMYIEKKEAQSNRDIKKIEKQIEKEVTK